jgi:dTDP-4-amino-4,6-dideoxygalactose transaminase
MAIMVGARPVFVDVLPDTYNIDPVDLRTRIKQCIEQGWGTPRIVVPVHEFGLAANLDAILEIAKEYKMEVVEDAACALGAAYKGKPVGTFAKMGIFSFHPRKAVTTGEGGAIVTNDDSLAEKCRMWRNHGQVFQNGDRDFRVAGLNYRMTEIQAAIGRVQLEKFPEILKKRGEIASRYINGLTECPGISLPANKPEHTWQTFMIVIDDTEDRSYVIANLAEKSSIGSSAGSIAGHCLKIYHNSFGYKPDDLPISAKLDCQGVALPMYASLSEQEQKQVVQSLSQHFVNLEI